MSTSLQAPVFPAASLFGQVIGDAFALSVVGYGIAISLGRIFALKYGYKVDSNQVGRCPNHGLIAPLGFESCILQIVVFFLV